MLTRRGLIGSLISLAAAPAIVRASSLMPVKVMDDATFEFSPFYTAYPIGHSEQMLDLLRKRVADAEGALCENIKIQLFGDRYYGISGKSSSVYYSDPLGGFGGR